jgi:hypothetical protein
MIFYLLDEQINNLFNKLSCRKFFIQKIIWLGLKVREFL